MKKKRAKYSDSERYLNLNPEVRRFGFEAAQHSARFGMSDKGPSKVSIPSCSKKRPHILKDIRELQNDGVTIFNTSDMAECRTIIIIGIPRSGTSMSAKVLDDLGVFMGERRARSVFEDVKLADALEKGSGDVLEIISNYNRRFSTWGFKRPMAWSYLKRYISIFRNPHIVVMFRDPFAIAKRNHISVGVNVEHELKRTVDLTRALVDFSLDLAVPKMLASYEKALSSPEFFVNQLSEFSGLNPTTEAFDRAVSNIQSGPDVYLKNSQTQFLV